MPFDQFDRVGQQRVFLLVDAGLVQGRVDEPGAQLLPMLNVGDYSHFERFRMEIPEYMKPHIPPNPRRRGSNETNDLRKIITESFRFSSNPEPGLEMADIAVNATRRALTGNLGIAGWRVIRRLMIHRPEHYIRVIALRGARHRHEGAPNMPALRHFTEGGKDMLAPRYSRWGRGAVEHGSYTDVRKGLARTAANPLLSFD